MRAPAGPPGTKPSVAVIGAGIGGLTLAAVLARIGVSCQVFEQAEEFTEIGAGVQLAPNAVRPLLRLGLGPRLRDQAVRIAATEVRSWQDRLIVSTPLGDECERLFAAPYYAMHRAHLHAALRAAAGPELVQFGRRLLRVEQRPAGVRLFFADGSTRDVDLVVGADGIHSVVRDALVRDTPVFSGLGIFRGLVPVDRLPPAAREPLVRVWTGPDKHLVCYPVAGGELVSFAATAPFTGTPAESWSAAADPAELRAAFAGWRGLGADVVHAADTVRRWALHDREPLPTWRTGAVTVVGDAAHPMLPFLAQGANQAVEDAMDLAACLVAGHGDVPAALTRYEALRAPRTAAIQQGARGNAALLHLADGARQRRRDSELRRSVGLAERAWLYGYRAGRVPVG